MSAPARDGGLQASQRSDLEATGWTYERCPGPLAKLAAGTLDVARRVFALPHDLKARCASPETNYQSGWRDPGNANRPSEVWHVGRNDPAHTWPSDLSADRDTVRELLERSIDAVGTKVDVLVETFGGAAGEVSASLRRGTSTVRLLHYRGGGSDTRFPEHTDFGIVSLFVAETGPGLELRSRGGAWAHVNVSDDRWVLAAGEMLARRVEGAIPPALHRVGAAREDRWSVVIFLHPHDDYPMALAGNEILTAGAFFKQLMQRVVASG